MKKDSDELVEVLESCIADLATERPGCVRLPHYRRVLAKAKACAEPVETEYRKALRTGVMPAIWPPIVMTEEDLQHFRGAMAAAGRSK